MGVLKIKKMTESFSGKEMWLSKILFINKIKKCGYNVYMAIYQEFSQLNTEGIYLKLQVGLVDLAFN